jgi:murein DD-endopeptidase MepM/ murein hydrolase activator NlpD
MKREKKPRKKKLMKRLKSKFRLTILNESTFEERFSYSLTPMNVIVMFGGLFFVFGLIIYLLVAFTPLKVYLVPGYVDVEYREEARIARMKVDSIHNVLAQQQTYLNSVITIFNGKHVEQEVDTTQSQKQRLMMSETDSLFDMEMKKKKRDRKAQEALLSGDAIFDIPQSGSILSVYSASHTGVDIQSLDGAPAVAAENGVVVFVGPSIQGGLEVHIQHPGQFISVYKNLEISYKRTGELVARGDAIGQSGNKFEESLGRHLHFELWKSGFSVDPTRYIVFGQ